MKRKKMLIYSLSIIFALYQITRGSSISMAAQVTADNGDVFQKQLSGVCQVEKTYKELVSEYPDSVYDAEDWKKSQGAYQYPVTAFDDDWEKYYSTAEKYAACQIPEEILSGLSTQELLELVIDFPLLINIYAYDSCEEGIREVAKYFNGMNELLKRYDCLDTVLEFYENYEIPQEKELDDEELLPENPSMEDYNKIVENESLMKRASNDARVMCILNLCEGIIEIASEEGRMTSQREKEATQIILQKNIEKQNSECVEGISVEYAKEDSLYYTWNQKYKITSLFNDRDDLLIAAYSRNDGVDTRGVLTLPGGGSAFYTIHGIWSNISNSTVSSYIQAYSTNKLKNRSNAVTCVQNGNTKYNCYNFAWLKDYGAYQNLWKECDFDNDRAFRDSSVYRSSSSAGVGWVGSNVSHAVYVVDKTVEYWDNGGGGNYHSEPMVKSKWGTSGPLMKHPLSLCPYPSVSSGMTYYAFKKVC